jgi:hypothetical protein
MNSDRSSAGTQIAFEHELFERARRSARGVELIVVAALHLRAIECDARSLQQAGRVASVVRIKTDADTARHEDLLIVKEERLIECLLDRARDIRGVLRARESVSAESQTHRRQNAPQYRSRERNS